MSTVEGSLPDALAGSRDNRPVLAAKEIGERAVRDVGPHQQRTRPMSPTRTPRNRSITPCPAPTPPARTATSAPSKSNPPQHWRRRRSRRRSPWRSPDNAQHKLGYSPCELPPGRSSRRRFPPRLGFDRCAKPAKTLVARVEVTATCGSGQPRALTTRKRRPSRRLACSARGRALRTRSTTHPARAAEDAPRQRTMTAVASMEWRARQRR
jgi:hypothetical protein